MSTSGKTVEDDRRSNDEYITIRVVFDGPPFAGKTTAARSLGESLGQEVFTPKRESDRTAWFDWVTYTGGRHEGREIRVEIVTVPGQAYLNDRRLQLLSWGDVVVFVADSGRSAFQESVDHFAKLRGDLEELGPRPVVVLANKRDEEDALDIEFVSSELGVDDSTQIVESVATVGTGIRQSFIFAVRAALAAGAARPVETNPDELLDALQMHVDVSQPAPMDDSEDASGMTDVSVAPSPSADVPLASSVGDDMVFSAPPVRKARLCAEAGDANRHIILNAEDWTILAEMVNGDAILSLRDGARSSRERLIERGLVTYLPAPPVIAAEAHSNEDVVPVDDELSGSASTDDDGAVAPVNSNGVEPEAPVGRTPGADPTAGALSVDDDGLDDDGLDDIDIDTDSGTDTDDEPADDVRRSNRRYSALKELNRRLRSTESLG